MPLYDYRCAACEKTTEVRHGFNDTYSEACADCGGAMRRVFNAAPIVFKGSGFYVTDSRAKPAAAADRKPAEGGKADDGTKPSEGGKPSESDKPAEGVKASPDSAAPATPAATPAPSTSSESAA